MNHDQERVPQDEVDAEIGDEEMGHEPVGSLSELFRGSHLRWATVNEEQLASVGTFQLLKYVPCGGVWACTDRRNLANIFAQECESHQFSKRLHNI